MTLRTGILLTVHVLAFLTGCSGRAPSSSSGSKPAPPAHNHSRVGPAGGVIVEWGGEDYHLELLTDRTTGEVVVYVLDGSAKKVTTIPTQSITLSLVGSPPIVQTLEAKPQDGDPMGQTSRYVGQNEALKKDGTLTGAISGEVNGKKYSGEFKVRSTGKN